MSGPDHTHARRWWILGVLCLSVLLVAIDNTIVNVALPTLNRRFDASTSDLQWIVDAYTVSFAGLLLVCGNIGDRRAVVGSAMSSSYGSLLAQGWGRLGIAGPVIDAGRESVGSGLAVAARGAGTQAEQLTAVVRTSFIHGLHAGSLTAAGAAALAGVAALVLRPSRDVPPRGPVAAVDDEPLPASPAR